MLKTLSSVSGGCLIFFVHRDASSNAENFDLVRLPVYSVRLLKEAKNCENGAFCSYYTPALHFCFPADG